MAGRRLLQPLPKPKKLIDHYADTQEHQHHHNCGAHILNGDRPKSPNGPELVDVNSPELDRWSNL
jgi:hypothetical protein